MVSMTGYGKARKTSKKYQISVELKSVNSRYLDINIKQPAVLAPLEAMLRETIKKNVLRGKIALFIDLQLNPTSDNDLPINKAKLDFYLSTLNAVKAKLQQNEPLKLEHILQFSDIFEPALDESDMEEIKPLLQRVTIEALQAFNTMRRKEGRHLQKDMAKRCEEIDSLCARIKKLSGNAARDEFAKLMARLEELVDANKLDRDRLEQEVALLSDKVDISEELTRLTSHIKQFSGALTNGGEAGKKLTFILQEMHREANTINSKTNNIEVSHEVIKIKESIEKIREQAQNVE